MKNTILYVPQGMFVDIDINERYVGDVPELQNVVKITREQIARINIKHGETKQIFAIFTDNLLTCSCFFVRDIRNRFCIFGHVDEMTNIIDPDRGLFAAILEKQQMYKIQNEEIEIYLERGTTRYPNQKLFGYKDYIMDFLTEKQKRYNVYEIQNYEQTIDEYREHTTQGALNIVYNSSHEKETGDGNRRGVIYYIQGNIFQYTYNGYRGNASSILSRITNNQIEQHFLIEPYNVKVVEAERLLYQEDGETLDVKCLYYDYLSNIKEAIKEKLENEHIKKYTEAKIDSLFKTDFIFPPMYIYKGKNVANRKIAINTKEINNDMMKYEACIYDIINVLSATEIQNLLDNSALEKFLLVQFNEQYNGISRNNNYYYKQLDDEKKHLVDNITNIAERMEQQLIREIQQLPPVTNKTTQLPPVTAKETQQQNTPPKATPTKEVVDGTEKLTAEVNKTNGCRIKEGVKSIKMYGKEEQYTPNTPQ